ncbi:MAG: GNAT family N-acetyltransferase [Clostridia bacterium]|nr:GNAT family N-acetyltransferase [Clostridia bacterium]
MEVQFKKLENQDVLNLKNYYKNCSFLASNYSAIFSVMWKNHLGMNFAIIENCLVLQNEYAGKKYFYYPVSLTSSKEEEFKALDKIEDYCKKNYIKLNFSAVPESRITDIVLRYGVDLKISNSRKWRDYLYNAEDFITYQGKKFSGQRNHVNKFKKLYPNYEFLKLSGKDGEKIYTFLKGYEYRQLLKNSVMAEEEMQGVYDLLPYLDELDLKVGAISVDGKIIAVSVAEKCGEQLIIHIEKALSEYSGAYPTMAHEMAKAYAGDAKYINREDDSGDAGLRKSKLQYNPCGLVNKYDVTPYRIIDGIKRIPSIACERVTIGEITENHINELYRLEFDRERNKFWGYDWREHVKGEPDKNFFLASIKKDFENKWEVPAGIFLNGKLIGEVVLHNFGYSSECEIGFRLLPEYEGFGYAQEAAKGYIYYALMELNVETVNAKCFKENERSKKTLENLGMRKFAEDEMFYYFYTTAKN